MDHRVRKWRRWSEQDIHRDVLAAYLRRHAWREVGAILDKADLPESYW